MQIAHNGTIQDNNSFCGIWKNKNKTETAQSVATPSVQSTAIEKSLKGMGIFSRAGLFLQNLHKTQNNSADSPELKATVDKINKLEEEYENLSNEALFNKTEYFKKALAQDGKSLEEILPDAYAAVREAVKRATKEENGTGGIRLNDSQLKGGISIHNGEIAEMKTGEGKTLTALLPAYLNALSGKGVHIMTTNDFLAREGYKDAKKVFDKLNITVGLISQSGKGVNNYEEKRNAYNQDITYGTSSEFGFDYLRDNIAVSKHRQVQRPYNFAIIDEADSVLIDEAKTPMILTEKSTIDEVFADEPSTETMTPEKIWKKATEAANRLKIDEDYTVDKKNYTVSFEDDESIYKALRLFGLSEEEINAPQDYESDDKTPEIEQANKSNIAYSYIQLAIAAKELYHKNVDYVVRNGEVCIIDKSTGRLLEGRKWTNGIHQAVEAKEGIKQSTSSNTLAKISFQNFFKLYPKLSGMTGTAATESKEFETMYNLGVREIETNKSVIREDEKDEIYLTKEAKEEAIVKEIINAHKTGRPVLIGTTSIKDSERLHDLLLQKGINANVLNAKEVEKEAYIIAQAGKLNAVTIATNMAGRGTDIKLGGDPEYEADEELQRLGLNKNSEEYKKKRDELVKKYTPEAEENHKEVVDKGGLYVIGTEKNQSRRIDNQLRGRAGRQGDPGKSKFILSLEDEILKVYGNLSLINKIAEKYLGSKGKVPSSEKYISTLFEQCQKNIESTNFLQRKNVAKYDEILNAQRQTVYGNRNKFLETEGSQELVDSMIKNQMKEFTKKHISPKMIYDEDTYKDLTALVRDVRKEYPKLSSIKMVDINGSTFEEISEKLAEFAVKTYRNPKTQTINTNNTADMQKDAETRERTICLKHIDKQWRKHLEQLEILRDEIRLTIGNIDHLQEYNRQADKIFKKMMADTEKDIISELLKSDSRYRKLNSSETKIA